ncbi:PorT family protein [Tamlana haliotis]|uniref:PorT family protein n=1 Tax=Pseudotamlana haliotis TaxID=2614804 RepID=A0A6N6MHB2_9FLAO|nr:porin family protein [Tamlana haliotis]KAB1068350.1 PorT family protein [Tamlana haliotis]
MKKILLSSLFLLGLANLNAQNIQYGIKGGLNFANVYGDNTENIDMVTAFNFGAMAEIPFSEKFSFQPELLFSGAGFSIDEDVTALNYINLPLMGKYYITNRLSLEAGPQIGFLVSAKHEDLDVKDAYNTVDFGLSAGLGYKLNNGLNFGVRYNYGLTDINNIEGLSSKNNIGALQLSIGYFFN